MKLCLYTIFCSIRLKMIFCLCLQHTEFEEIFCLCLQHWIWGNGAFSFTELFSCKWTGSALVGTISFFLILFFNFTILYWFCRVSTWIRHRYTRVPHPEPCSLLPPRTIPLGRPSAPAPSIQYCASNLDWRLVSYMILYMFQCHSPKSSHSSPLPQSPKDSLQNGRK